MTQGMAVNITYVRSYVVSRWEKKSVVMSSRTYAYDP